LDLIIVDELKKKIACWHCCKSLYDKTNPVPLREYFISQFGIIPTEGRNLLHYNLYDFSVEDLSADRQAPSK
jgi:hypothetical protein